MNEIFDQLCLPRGAGAAPAAGELGRLFEHDGLFEVVGLSGVRVAPSVRNQLFEEGNRGQSCNIPHLLLTHLPHLGASSA